VPPKGVSM
uniref:Bradykinin-related peptide Pnor-7 n=1 Tax=Pithecopus nordestinus TaxID=2034992 RepID=BRK7_PITNO|nr:RecName: Full=Bradykinin-related peptide Pnor-7 [Pithecopus nordestinus]